MKGDEPKPSTSIIGLGNNSEKLHSYECDVIPVIGTSVFLEIELTDSDSDSDISNMDPYSSGST